MSKLPLSQCPECSHPLWDNHADDFDGRPLESINLVCIYCGAAMRYDLLAGKFASVDVDALPEADRVEIRAAQLILALVGTDGVAGPELARRNRDRKTS